MFNVVDARATDKRISRPSVINEFRILPLPHPSARRPVFDVCRWEMNVRQSKRNNATRAVCIRHTTFGLRWNWAVQGRSADAEWWWMPLHCILQAIGINDYEYACWSCYIGLTCELRWRSVEENELAWRGECRFSFSFEELTWEENSFKRSPGEESKNPKPTECYSMKIENTSEIVWRNTSRNHKIRQS